MARILLIAPSFFGYRDRVAEELRRQGHEVDVADDRPSEGVAFRSVAKVAPGLLSGAVARHASALRGRIAEGGYGHVAYLGGMTFLFTRGQLARMRAAAPRAAFTAYLWDSLANSPRIAGCLDLFDRVLSFEPGDCRPGGPELRPLFYSGSYSGLPLEPEGGFEWDACFVGSVHQPSKFQAVDAMARSLRERGLRVFTYYYMPSRSAAVLRRARCAPYRGVELSYEPLPAARVAEVYSRSKAVLDSPQAGQSGLTMRTLEAVGARRKLVTANADVLGYDFALPGDVAVWSPDGEVGRDFFDRPYEPLRGSVYDGYSIGSFARALLGEGPAFSGYKKGADAT